jgi:hypothetical protein
MPQPENEWEYDAARRVARAVGALEPRDGDMGILLHMRWQVDCLMKVVKMVHLTAHELAALIAVLAPTAGRPVINGRGHDVRERVADAVKGSNDASLGALMRLRSELCELMDVVKLNDLSVTELVAMLAVLAPANGRRLLVDALDEALAPILRLVDNAVDLRNVGSELAKIGADVGNELAGCAPS